MGGSALAVGPAADYQARALEDGGVPFACLLDPQRKLYREFGLGRMTLRNWLDPQAWRRYVRAMFRGGRQGMITTGVNQRPGLAIVDASGDVHFVHRGTGLGDYPPLSEVVGELRRIAQ